MFSILNYLYFRSSIQSANNQLASPEPHLLDNDQHIPILSNTYTDYKKHDNAHEEFKKKFTNNTFGHSCSVCDRLWFKIDLKNINARHEEILRTITVI